MRGFATTMYSNSRCAVRAAASSVRAFQLLILGTAFAAVSIFLALLPLLGLLLPLGA